MLASPTHVLHKLHWEISQLKKALVSEPEKLAYTHAPAYFAVNCAVTAGHLADWVWEASGSDQQAEILQRLRCGAAQASKSSFQKALMERCRAIHICRQIATGSKHMTLTLHPDPNVRVDPCHGSEVFINATRGSESGRVLPLKFATLTLLKLASRGHSVGCI